jgi:hypothetical protein
MPCPICNATAGFSEAEYLMLRGMGGVRAPALQCRACRAIVLHEVAAHTDAELAAVRLAQAARRSIVSAPESLSSERECAPD